MLCGEAHVLYSLLLEEQDVLQRLDANAKVTHQLNKVFHLQLSFPDSHSLEFLQHFNVTRKYV